MPICTTCTQQLPYLYTVYESAHNLRLEQCPNCLNFADPYVEHDPLILLLDLILLKRGVFRHLLFNRGFEPRQASKSGSENKSQDENEETRRKMKILAQREKDRWKTIFRLGFFLVFVDAFIRWSHLRNPEDETVYPGLWSKKQIEPLVRIFIGCIIESVAFHAGIAATSALFTKLSFFWPRLLPGSVRSRPGISEGLRLSHVPLTILYSSLTKLFLLLLLTLWKPSTLTISRPRSHVDAGENILKRILANEFVQSSLEMLDDDKLDREWVVRNVLGGMAAGFGLRVVLDIKPIFTTIIILVGWAVKTSVANGVSAWVNKDSSDSNVFLAYSIP